MKRALLGRVVRLLVAVGLTAFILWKSHPAHVLEAAGQASVGWIVVAVLLVLVDRAINAYRWVVLLRPVAAASRLRLWPVMRIFFVSTFVGTFLPGVGGDAVRAYSLARLDVPGAASVVSVLMDRMLGLLSVLVMAVAGLFVARDLAINPAVLAALAITLSLCGATALIVFSPRAAGLARSLLRLSPWPRLERTGSALLDAAQAYATSHRVLFNVLAGSLAVQALRIAQAYCLGLSLGIPASPGAYLAFVPLILLVMLVPVTVSGLGTGQLAFVGLFSRIGVPDAQSFALSVLFVALGAIGNLPGLILYLAGQKPPRGERLGAGG